VSRLEAPAGPHPREHEERHDHDHDDDYRQEHGGGSLADTGKGFGYLLVFERFRTERPSLASFAVRVLAPFFAAFDRLRDSLPTRLRTASTAPLTFCEAPDLLEPFRDGSALEALLRRPFRPFSDFLAIAPPGRCCRCRGPPTQPLRRGNDSPKSPAR